jgi:hypothetical protein
VLDNSCPPIGRPQAEDDSIAFEDDRRPEYRPVEVAGPVLAGDHQEAGHRYAGLRDGESSRLIETFVVRAQRGVNPASFTQPTQS